MKRRNFIAAATSASLLTACGQQKETDTANKTSSASASGKTYKWSMVTTWPPGFQALGTGAEYLAKLIDKMSNGRIKIKVYGANELVPALEVFDAVSLGSAEMGHGGAYYWKGKLPAAPFFCAVPFGLAADEMNAWLLKSDGLTLWQELYAPYNLLPMPAGNTGMQMAGWFNKEINGIDDLKGLKMRIPGLGGEVLKAAGGNPELIAGGEIFSALEMGRIDAAEFVGPYNDLAFGFHKAAKHYYYPGWHEPCATLEAIINKKAFDALPEDLQEIVKSACLQVNNDMHAEFTAKNAESLKILKEQHGVVPKRLPQAVLDHLQAISEKLIAQIADTNELSKRIYNSYHQFKKDTQKWQEISRSL